MVTVAIIISKRYNPMDMLLLFPIIIPFFTAILAILSWKHRQVQRVIGIIGTVLLFAASIALFVVVRREGIQIVQIGSWQAPFGITLGGGFVQRYHGADGRADGLCGGAFLHCQHRQRTAGARFLSAVPCAADGRLWLLFDG